MALIIFFKYCIATAIYNNKRAFGVFPIKVLLWVVLQIVHPQRWVISLSWVIFELHYKGDK